MILDFTKADVYVLLLINGVFTGIGSAVGQYFSNKFITKKIDTVLDNQQAEINMIKRGYL